MKRARIVVKGYVQGVGFRWFAARTAERLHLTGWVRNRADGSVESVVEGESDSVHAYIAELRRGPSSATVTDLDLIEGEYRGEFDRFRIT